jgi:hypothetical protein
MLYEIRLGILVEEAVMGEVQESLSLKICSVSRILSFLRLFSSQDRLVLKVLPENCTEVLLQGSYRLHDEGKDITNTFMAFIFKASKALAMGPESIVV